MRTFIVNIDDSLQGAEDDIDELERKWGAEEIEHKCHNCAHYLQDEHDGSCGSYICKGYSNRESEVSNADSDDDYANEMKVWLHRRDSRILQEIRQEILDLKQGYMGSNCVKDDWLDCKSDILEIIDKHIKEIEG